MLIEIKKNAAALSSRARQLYWYKTTANYTHIRRERREKGARWGKKLVMHIQICIQTFKSGSGSSRRASTPAVTKEIKH